MHSVAFAVMIGVRRLSEAGVNPPSHVMKMGEYVECSVSTTWRCVGLGISCGALSVGMVWLWRKAATCARRSVMVWVRVGGDCIEWRVCASLVMGFVSVGVWVHS